MMATIFNSSILNSSIMDSAMLHKTLTQTSSIWLKLIHSDSTWWWQPSWILPCWIQTLPIWIQTLCYLLSDLLKNILPPLWPWLKLIESDHIDDGNHLEFCHLGFSHLHKKNFTHSISLKLMIAAILNSAILDSAILHKKNFTHSISLKLMIAAILNSAILDSAILHKKTSDVHSDSTWWWQPSWILPCWIQYGCHHQVESDWMSEVFFVQMAESKMAEFKMVAII